MKEHTVLITGANRGIGLQFARVFTEMGWHVIACCRDTEHAAELAALAKKQPTIEIHALDVTDYERMSELSSQLEDRKIDILLSNAGVYGPRTAFGSIEPAPWREVFEVNTIAPLMLAQNFVEQVAASDKKIIAMVSSKMGSIADNSSGGSHVYRSSKTALNQVARSLSIDLCDRGISVVTLHPGWVQTDMGGSNALVSVKKSVAEMVKTLSSAAERNGEFIDLDGSIIPW